MTTETEPKSRRLVRATMAVVLLALNIADVASTRAVLAAGGVEQNPVMRPLLGLTVAPWLVKSLVAIIVGVLLWAAPADDRRSEAAVAAVIAFYIGVIVWNLFQFSAA